MTQAPLILVDGYGLLFRSFFGLSERLSPEGVPVHAVQGVLWNVLDVAQTWPEARVALAWDTGKKTFRHDLYPPYKSHRPPTPEALKPQFALVREAVSALGTTSLEVPGYEADDVLASVAATAYQQGHTVWLLSADKDLMQCVTEDGSHTQVHVAMMHPTTKAMTHAQEVYTKFGVWPHQIVDALALMGDASDHVPGVPGIGPKKAAALLETYGTLHGVYAAVPSMAASKQRDALMAHEASAWLSQQLVQLAVDVPPTCPLESIQPVPPRSAAFRDFCRQHGLRQYG